MQPLETKEKEDAWEIRHQSDLREKRHRQGHGRLRRRQCGIASDKKTLVFLSIEGTRLSQKGYGDDIHEEGFAPLKDLMKYFVEAGGEIYVCSPCFKKRKLDENNLVAGAVVVGGAKLVEFMGEACPSVSY